MDNFPRPKEESIFEKKEKVPGTCPECGGSDIKAYRVLTDGGWWNVVKCQECLYSLDRQLDKNQYAPCKRLWDLM
jgi:uncharacterized Zn finger protein